MSDCTPFRELISAELDAELMPGEEQELVSHLAGCSACQVYRGRLKKTVKAVRQLDPSLLGELPESASADVLARLEAYRAVGIEAFILSGYPHLDECERVGRLVLPHLKHGPPG